MAGRGWKGFQQPSLLFFTVRSSLLKGPYRMLHRFSLDRRIPKLSALSSMAELSQLSSKDAKTQLLQNWGLLFQSHFAQQCQVPRVGTEVINPHVRLNVPGNF
jgi:hypothetical protein